MPNWEYLVRHDCDEKVLNQLGKEGWELVAVVFDDRGNSVIVFYFKRPLP